MNNNEAQRVRAQCAKAIRDYRQYRKIHPEAFQVWACSERKGAALLARRIARIIRKPNPEVCDCWGKTQPTDTDAR